MNPVQTLDFLPALQVHYENAPSAEPTALRRVRRAQAYPAANPNPRFNHSPIDTLIDLKNGYAETELQMITHHRGVRHFFINFRRFGVCMS